MSISSRIIKVGAVKILEIVIMTIVRLVSVPLFLYTWDPILYGEWLILYSFVGYFLLGNLGFGQAAANEMTMFVARGERENALITYQSTFVIIILIGFGLVSLSALIGWLLPLEQWMGMSLIIGKDFQIVLVLFATYVSVWFLSCLFLAGYRCEGRYHRGIVYQNASLLSEFVGLAAMLLKGFGPVSCALVILLLRVIVVIFMMIDLKIVIPWLRLGASRAQTSELRRILSPSLSFVAFPAGNAMINQGIVIAIGVLVGPVAVVLWSSIRTLVNLVLRLFDIVIQAFYPEVSMAWGVKNKAILRKLHRVSCQYSLWLGLFSIAGLAVFGPWIFVKWTQGKLVLDIQLFWGFLGLIALRSLWFTSYVMPSAINKHQRLTVAYIIASAVGLGISIYMLQFGLPFTLIGFASVELVMVAVVIPQSISITEDRVRDFIFAVIPPPNLISVLRMTEG